MRTKICPQCSSSVPIDADVCPNCKYDWQADPCPGCGKRISDTAYYCPYCKYDLVQLSSPKAARSGRSEWIEKIFEAKIVGRGGIVRRKIGSVARFASVAQLRAEVIQRGFHMVKVGDQFVIYCRSDVEMIC